MSATRFTLATLFVLFASSSFAQGIPSGEWTSSERQWVEQARTLYQKQGLSFNDDQAGSAVAEMRAKSKPQLRGVPKAEWSPFEQQAVAQMHEQYAKSGITFTEEQEQLAVASMRERMAKMAGSMATLQALAAGKIPAPAVPVNQAPVAGQNNSANLSEEQLASRLAQFPPKKGPIEVKSRRDGFDVNGQTFVDPEGRITVYNFNVLTGDVTYVAQTGAENIIKVARLGTNSEPVRIGTAQQNSSGKWEITSVTGKKLSGDSLSVTPKGVLVARDTSAFIYEPGKGIRSITVPSGYRLAQIQHGDVESTGYVLLEKQGAEGSGNSATALFNTLKDAGRMFGLNTKEDYALMHVDTGKLYSLNIQVDGKNVSQMYNCKKRNAVANTCNDMISFESLYRNDGSPNMSHYFWKTYWMSTPSGPIAITMENGVKDIFIIDLNTGKKVVAFNRTLGIQDFAVYQHGNGAVSIKANWMFQAHEIEDAVAHLNTISESTGGAEQAKSVSGG